MIAGTGARDVQQVAFCVVDFFEIRIVCDRLDPLLQRDHFVVLNPAAQQRDTPGPSLNA